MSFFDKILDFLDRHQLSLAIVFVVHLIVFFFIMFTTFEHNIDLFEVSPRMKIEEETDEPLDLSDLEIPDFSSEDFSRMNVAVDANDSRESGENWSECDSDNSENPYLQANNSAVGSGDGAGNQNNATSSSSQAKEKDDPNSKQENETSNEDGASQSGGGKIKYEGDGNIRWSLKDRTNYRKSKEYLPPPFYASLSPGMVFVEIKVNRQGLVTAARIIKEKSKYSSEYLGEQSLKYSKKARFNASSSASKSQAGFIIYWFTFCT